jgi:hypothetical protein
MPRALLALFTRALREDVRAKSMYWARAGLVAIVLCQVGFTNLGMGWAGAPGLFFFQSVIGMNLLFISLAGLSYFSSAITEEKEEMTLGLLRMTNLNPLSILLGKSASRQIGALLLLLSQVPFTLLAVALGGVTLAQIIAAYTCLGAYTLFLGNAALFHSVISRRTAYAALLTAALLFVFFFGAAIIRHPVLWTLKFFQLISSEQPGPILESFLTHWQQTLPTARLAEIGVTGFHDGPICFQVVSNVLLGFGFFLAAWGAFDLFCSEQHDAAPARGLLRTRTKRIRLFSPGRAWRHALLWKDFHFLGGGQALVLSRIIIYGCIIGAILVSRDYFSNRPLKRVDLGYLLLWTMFVALLIEGAFIAARVFRQERIWKTWSSLAMLPLSIRRIAFQKVLGCILSDWPALLIFALGIVLSADDWLPDFFKMLTHEPDSWMGVAILFFTVGMVVLFYHLVADLSLRLKWGALPLSIGITYVASFLVTGMSFLMFREGAFIILDVGVVVLISLLHVDIGRRLARLASED